MRNTTLIRLVSAACLGIVGIVAFSYSAPAYARSLPELREQLKSRYADILQQKSDGKIGETYLGYLAVVRPEYAADAVIKNLIGQENADRKELYAEMAKQLKVSPEEVAARNAAREFEKAKPGQWLRYAAGWKQKP